VSVTVITDKPEPIGLKTRTGDLGLVSQPEISRVDALSFYAYSAKLLLFACSWASSDSASFTLDSGHQPNVHKPTWPLIRQSKRHNFVGSLPSKIASPACGNHYKLFAALLSYIRNWRSVRAGGQLCYP
jgi:hypothetical protein